MSSSSSDPLFRIRTVTAFVTLAPQDFPTHTDVEDGEEIPWCRLTNKIGLASKLLQRVQKELTTAGYEVQTLRIATNPFGEWIHDDKKGAIFQAAILQKRLKLLNLILKENNITFCSVGPAQSVEEIPICLKIIKTCPFVSCSATVAAGDVATAHATAKLIQQIAVLPQMNGLGNFRFCAASSTCPPGIPFFPVAKGPSLADQEGDGGNGLVGFALGLENGRLASHWLKKAGSMANIPTVFQKGMTAALTPVQDICQAVAQQYQYSYLGMDTSLNPSLDSHMEGSVAAAIEGLQEINCFGGTGTVGAAAAITTVLQSLPSIKLTGYCGLMLPVCEDHRLAELASASIGSTSKLRIADLLSVSSVCGVGIDTVPLPGNVSQERLTSLILDVAGLAARWNKPLSCRVLPFEGKKAGELTDFDSPYMVNTTIMEGLLNMEDIVEHDIGNGIATMSSVAVGKEEEIQVKIQSLSVPVATTHKVSLANLLDSKGNPSLNQLQDAIWHLVNMTSTGDFTDLTGSTMDKLSLSYLDAQGDLVPLTSQDEWARAILQRQVRTTNNKAQSKALVVFAQVLQQNNVGSTGASYGGSSPQLEDRLAQIEKLLLSVANNQSSSGSSSYPESPARCKDYKSVVKEQQARIQSRLNKVKTMNAVSSAPSTPTRSYSPVPVSAAGAPAMPVPPGATGTSDALHDFLHRIVSERQEGMQQLMDSRMNEMKAWDQAQEDMKATIKQAMAEMETKIDAKLEAKLSAHNLQFQKNIQQFEKQTAAAAKGSAKATAPVSTTTAVASSGSLERKLDNVQERLDGIEKHILRQPAPQSVASSASDGVSSREIAEVKEQVESFKKQIINLLSVRMDMLEQKLNSSASGNDGNDNGNAVEQMDGFKNQIKNLFLVRMTGMEQRLSSMASSNRHVMNEQLVGFKNQIKNLLLTRLSEFEHHLEQTMLQHNTSSSATPSSSLPNADVSSSSSRSPTFNDIHLQQQVDGMKKQMDSLIQTRLHALEQKVQVLNHMPGGKVSPSASPTNVSKDASSASVSTSSSNGGGNLPEMTRTVTALVKQLMETFQQKLSQSHQQIQSTQDKAFQGLAKDVAKRVETSQATILKNQKQYASALRQTVVRLHDETRAQMSSVTKMNGSSERTLKNSSSRGLSPLPNERVLKNSSSRGLSPNPDGATSWDAIKEVVVSSHEELRESQQRSMQENRDYLVECIELSQHAILAKLTSNTVSESALDETVSEAEQRLATLVEQIQAQATAAILDRMDQQALLAGKNRWRRLTPDESVLVADPAMDGSGAVSPVSPLAAADNMVARATSPSPSGDTLPSGMTAVDMEELLLSAMEKLEVAMEANCEQIQAQATAAILDKVEACQNIVVSKTEGSQVVLLDKMVHLQGLTSGKLDTTLALIQGLDKLARNGKLDATLNMLQGLQTKLNQPQNQQPQAPPRDPRKFETRVASNPAIPQVPRRSSGMDGSHYSHQPRQINLRRGSDMDGSNYSHFSASNYNRHGGESKYGGDDYGRGGARRSKQPPSESEAYQRFVELETRSQRLERAYKLIRFNNPTLEGGAESSPTPMVDAPVPDWIEEEKQDPQEESDDDEAFPMLKNRSSAAARWLTSHPVTSFNDKGSMNSSVGYSSEEK